MPDRAWLTECTGMAQHDAALTDFAETATLISMMDLIVTIDTAVAHLAGALGVPTWIMLRRSPDWRWLTDRADSPWYPSARLFRQAALGRVAGGGCFGDRRTGQAVRPPHLSAVHHRLPSGSPLRDRP